MIINSLTQHQSYYEKINLFEEKWDDVAKVPYLINKKDTSFVSYDNEKSIRLKLNRNPSQTFIQKNSFFNLHSSSIQNQQTGKPGIAKQVKFIFVAENI